MSFIKPFCFTLSFVTCFWFETFDLVLTLIAETAIKKKTNIIANFYAKLPKSQKKKKTTTQIRTVPIYIM